MSATAPAPTNPELVTALQLSSNKTFLLASHPLCPETLRTLEALAPVAFIAAFDREHTMFLEQYTSTFPDAVVFSGKSWGKLLAGKAVLMESEGVDVVAEATGGEVVSCPFGTSHVNEDVGFLHVASRTLVQADLLMNLPPTEQYSKSTARSSVPFITSLMQPSSGMYKRMLKHVVCKDKTTFSERVKQVSSWDFDRIVPCHGDVIETGGKSVWDSTFESFLR